jgi:hypothetical protein
MHTTRGEQFRHVKRPQEATIKAVNSINSINSINTAG